MPDADPTGCGGPLEIGAPDLRLHPEALAGGWRTNDIMALAAGGMALKSSPCPSGGAAERVKAMISGMRFPDLISRVLVRCVEGDAICVMMVHGYENHSGAIDATGQNADDIEDGFPDEDFEFSYVKSEHLAEEDIEGFVNVPI